MDYALAARDETHAVSHEVREKESLDHHGNALAEQRKKLDSEHASSHSELETILAVVKEALQDQHQ